MLLAGVLIGAGYAPREEAAQGRSDWARADTDSVGRKTAVITGDSLSGYTGSGGAVQVFTGNVTGIQDSTELFADWGKRYADADSLTLVSNVVVIHKRDTLRADTVHYRESIKVGRAVGNVRWCSDCPGARGHILHR